MIAPIDWFNKKFSVWDKNKKAEDTGAWVCYNNPANKYNDERVYREWMYNET